MDGQRWFRCRWWSADSPLPPRHHRCRCLTRGRPHPLPWTSIWRHHRHLHPLQRQLLVAHHLRWHQWSSEPSLPVVGSPLASSMLHVDASSSLATAQIGWPHLPPPMGGPNGPLSGQWRLPPRWPFGGRGGGEARARTVVAVWRILRLAAQTGVAGSGSARHAPVRAHSARSWPGRGPCMDGRNAASRPCSAPGKRPRRVWPSAGDGTDRRCVATVAWSRSSRPHPPPARLGRVAPLARTPLRPSALAHPRRCPLVAGTASIATPRGQARLDVAAPSRSTVDLADASLDAASHRARRGMSRGRKPALPGGRIWRRSPTTGSQDAWTGRHGGSTRGRRSARLGRPARARHGPWQRAVGPPHGDRARGRLVTPARARAAQATAAWRLVTAAADRLGRLGFLLKP
jgi:hypothetical protein